MLGLGGCVDYELKVSAPALEQLIDEYQIHEIDLIQTETIDSDRDLVISILCFLRRGEGGERYVASAEALETFAARFPHRITLGGTSVRAGLAMSRLGVPSMLHLVSMNSLIRRLLPPDCDYLSSGGGDDPVNPHLIVQYDQGLHICTGDIDIRVPFPNRLIYVNDPANEELRLSGDLGAALAHARLLLISGFNAVRDEVVLSDRLASLRHHLERLPVGSVVYYEDAGFHRADFSQHVREELLARIDFYGMNEDELQAHVGRTVDLLSVEDVVAALIEISTLIPVPTLVIHTKYWAAAVGERAAQCASALEQGILVASARYAFGDGYDDADLDRLRGRLRRVDAGDFASSIERRLGYQICCQPGFLLEVENPTTIGLGDTFVGGFLATILRKDGNGPGSVELQSTR